MARAGMKAELIAERVGHNDGGALAGVRQLVGAESPWGRRFPRNHAVRLLLRRAKL